MSALIRIKTADLLCRPDILEEAKAFCTKVTFEKDEVAFEPQPERLVPLVVLLSQENVPYAATFSKKELELSMVKDEA